MQNITEKLKISDKTKKLLEDLAKKYETCDFYKNDPSFILHEYKNPCDIEVASFIMALLSFGKRELFIKKAKTLFELAGKSPSEWIKSGKWQKEFLSGNKKFYRFYSYDDLRDVFAVLQHILLCEKSFGNYVKKQYENSQTIKAVSKSTYSDNLELKKSEKVSDTPRLDCIISDIFANCKAIPHSATTANKRINMFLRWMVRVNSPVDVGLWEWFSPKDLIIPLDTHVLSQAIKLCIIPSNSKGNIKTAIQITNVLKTIWQEDPCRGDFALFGLGVNSL